jgi:hypothetical protein
MDRWLGAVEKDGSNRSLAAKVAADRPADLIDRCSNIPGVDQADGVCTLDAAQTRFGTPATVAGESIATDTNKCQLKPLRRSDYYPKVFTDAQWAALASAFPAGVCDFSKPGVQQQATIPWRSYQDAGGNVVYGGRSLGPAPADSGGGWASGAFAGWRAARTG